VAGGCNGSAQGGRHGVVILDDEHVHGLILLGWVGLVGLVRY
jgi:hypothetical protein